MKKKRQTRESVAYHEAGHAVAAVVRKVKFESVRIKDEGDEAGRLTPDPGWQRAYDVAVVAYAGPAAEKYWGSETAWLWGTADGDHEVAEAACRVVAEAARCEVDLLIRTAIRDARDLVARHWEDIINVAFALRDRGELSDEEVNDLVATA